MSSNYKLVSTTGAAMTDAAACVSSDATCWSSVTRISCTKVALASFHCRNLTEESADSDSSCSIACKSASFDWATEERKENGRESFDDKMFFARRIFMVYFKIQIPLMCCWGSWYSAVYHWHSGFCSVLQRTPWIPFSWKAYGLLLVRGWHFSDGYTASPSHLSNDSLQQDKLHFITNTHTSKGLTKI